MYEEPWTTMNVADLNVVKSLKTLLKDSDTAEQRKGLHATYIAISDMAAEYFLQPPYIYDVLIIVYS